MSEILAAYGQGRSGSQGSRKMKLSSHQSMSPEFLPKPSFGAGIHGVTELNPDHMVNVSIQNSGPGLEMNQPQTHLPYEINDKMPRQRQKSELADCCDGVYREAYATEQLRSQKSMPPSDSSHKGKQRKKKRTSTAKDPQ
jgi:hypothetical protein